MQGGAAHGLYAAVFALDLAIEASLHGAARGMPHAIALLNISPDPSEARGTLYILGKRVVAIKTDKGWSGHLVATSPPHVGDVVLAASLNEDGRVETAAPKAAAA
jgi:hypothetical protein